MTKIPSIEKTDDFIFRSEIKKGTAQHDPDAPHLLVFDLFAKPAGPFHSMDVTALKDGFRTNDIEIYSFEHLRHSDIAYVRFKFYDNANLVSEHHYLLTVILRYLTSPQALSRAD